MELIILCILTDLTECLFLSPHASQLDNLPENSPINIVQTPIPITTSVPKRAKSQRKKALAAALATAQEYSEISMEQKKLQVETCSIFTGQIGWIHAQQFERYSYASFHQSFIGVNLFFLFILT